MLLVDFHPIAIREAKSARRYYHRRAGKLIADRFIASLNAAINRVAQFPMAGAPHSLNTRVVILRKYPYNLVYRATKTELYVIAVAHKSRRPGYWHRRVP